MTLLSHSSHLDRPHFIAAPPRLDALRLSTQGTLALFALPLVLLASRFLPTSSSYHTNCLGSSNKSALDLRACEDVSAILRPQPLYLLSHYLNTDHRGLQEVRKADSAPAA